MHSASALATASLRASGPPRHPPPKDAPAVSIVQPLCGVEIFSRETLRSIFALDYPDYEIIFCLASADDPIAPLVRGAIDAHPERPARLLVGDDRVSANPKLNNVVKGWKAARHDWVIIADSNVSDAAGLYPAPARALAPQQRHRLRAADRVAAENVRGGDRMRLPQHL